MGFGATRERAHLRPNGRGLWRDRDLQAVFSLSLVAVMGVASLSPAFPKLAGTLDVSGAQIGLLITTFTLPAVFLSPLFGLLADRVGHRRVLIPSLFLFAIAGVSCAFTRDFGHLLFLRGLQGVGAAPLQALSIAIVGDLYDGSARAAALGLNGMVISAGAVIYPIIGGLAATAGAFYPFAFPVLAIPVGFLLLRRFDYEHRGLSLGIGWQIRGVLRSAAAPRSLGLFLAGALTMVLFFGAQVTYLPLLLGERFSASPLTIGIILSVTHVMFAVAASQFSRLDRRIGAMTLMGIAFAAYGAAAVLVPLMTSAWLLALPAALFGLAHGVNIPAQQIGLVGQPPREFRAAFMSLNTTIIRGGQTAGPMLVGTFYLMGGYQAAFLVSAALAFSVSAAIFVLLARSARASRPEC